MYKHIIIAISLASSLACSAETKTSESTKESEKDLSQSVVNKKIAAEIVEDKLEIAEKTDKETIPVKEVIESKTEIKIENLEIDKVESVKKEPVKVIATSSPSHSSFDVLLKKYVTSAGVVNYTSFQSEKSKLDAYLVLLSKNTPKSGWTRNEKLAYWINLYNAGTIQLILKNKTVKSIMDINGGKAWDLKFVKSGDKTLSLNQIENEIIRPTFKEPRIHFAVNCAAKSCPKLLNGAFYPTTLEKQLETATRKFINNKSKNTITASSIKVSKIFEWYAVDFGGKAGLINYFNKYSTVKINSSATISYNEYDWKLNN